MRSSSALARFSISFQLSGSGSLASGTHGSTSKVAKTGRQLEKSCAKAERRGARTLGGDDDVADAAADDADDDDDDDGDDENDGA